jgi:hypothetical protein
LVVDDFETKKDTAQVVVDSGLDHVGRIMGIVVDAARGITRELGDWATEVFEMREASHKARADREGADAADDDAG